MTFAKGLIALSLLIMSLCIALLKVICNLWYCVITLFCDCPLTYLYYNVRSVWVHVAYIGATFILSSYSAIACVSSIFWTVWNAYQYITINAAPCSGLLIFCISMWYFYIKTHFCHCFDTDCWVSNICNSPKHVVQSTEKHVHPISLLFRTS